MALFLIVLMTVLFPPILLMGFYVVNPREEVVVLSFGEYVKTHRRPGINWAHPVGRDLRRISTQDTTLEVPVTTVVDVIGNPIQVSAVVLYRVIDSKRAALDVVHHHRYVADQASAVIKRVASTFPYESASDAPCLKKEGEVVSKALVSDLQAAVDAAGIEVLSVRFNDLTYAPEIAQAMLMRQQALALIDARKTIVDGAVNIVSDAVSRLRSEGLELDAHQRDQLISNLLVVICSGEQATPVVQVGNTAARRAA